MRLVTSLVCLILSASGMLIPPRSADAQTLTKTLVTDQLPGAVFVTSPKRDYRRLFVLQLDGRIRIVKNGTLLATPFLNIGSTGLNKLSWGGERGLLGMAFHPLYSQNGFFYICYTNLQGNPIVERYRVDASNPDLANADRKSVV